MELKLATQELQKYQFNPMTRDDYAFILALFDFDCDQKITDRLLKLYFESRGIKLIGHVELCKKTLDRIKITTNPTSNSQISIFIEKLKAIQKINELLNYKELSSISIELDNPMYFIFKCDLEFEEILQSLNYISKDEFLLACDLIRRVPIIQEIIWNPLKSEKFGYLQDFDQIHGKLLTLDGLANILRLNDENSHSMIIDFYKTIFSIKKSHLNVLEYFMSSRTKKNDKLVMFWSCYFYCVGSNSFYVLNTFQKYLNLKPNKSPNYISFKNWGYPNAKEEELIWKDHYKLIDIPTKICQCEYDIMDVIFAITCNPGNENELYIQSRDIISGKEIVRELQLRIQSANCNFGRFMELLILGVVNKWTYVIDVLEIHQCLEAMRKGVLGNEESILQIINNRLKIWNSLSDTEIFNKIEILYSQLIEK